MNKLLNNILLSATLLIINGSNNVYSAEQYEELGLNDFTYDYLSVNKNYSIDVNGALYRTNEETGDSIYPIYDGYKCYDLGFAVSVVSKNKHYTLNNSTGNYNLVALPNKADNVLDLSNSNSIDNEEVFKIKIPSNTNLIIPERVTLNMNNNIQLYIEQNQTNNAILVLGNITRDLKQNANTIVNNMIHIASVQENTDVDHNILVLFGPNSSVITNKDRVPDSKKKIIYSGNIQLNWLLYPCCNLGDSVIEEDGKQIDNNCLFFNHGTLYLNRCYSINTDIERNKIQGLIYKSINIVIPEYTEIENVLHTQNNSKYDNEYKYFNNLFYPNDGSGKCIKETPSKSIFKLDEDGKQILCLNENNKFAKYDEVFWNQCQVENGIYSFVDFVNSETNKDKYVDVSTLEDLFTDGKTYRKTGLLQNMPNEIFVGLIGNKDINIKFYALQDTLNLHGDNSEYTGTITIPPTIHEIYIFNKNSIIKNISYNEKQYKTVIEEDNKIHYYEVDGENIEEIKPEEIGLTFHYIDQDNSNECKHKWDLYKDGNKVDINLSEEEYEDKTIILKDSGEVKNNKVQITGNNKGFKGIIITTPEVKEVVFGKNSFVRTVNINGTPLKYTFTGDNTVIDYNDYKTLETKNKNVKVNVVSNNGASYLKNEIINSKKKVNINVEKINVGKNGRLTFGHNNPLILGKK